MSRYREWTLDSDNAAGGVTLDSDTILLDRQPYWEGNEVAKPSAVFTKQAKPSSSWDKETLIQMRTLPDP